MVKTWQDWVVTEIARLFDENDDDMWEPLNTVNGDIPRLLEVIKHGAGEKTWN